MSSAAESQSLSQARACVAAIQVHLLFPEDRPAQAD
jgi:hypothetical protein